MWFQLRCHLPQLYQAARRLLDQFQEHSTRILEQDFLKIDQISSRKFPRKQHERCSRMVRRTVGWYPEFSRQFFRKSSPSLESVERPNKRAKVSLPRAGSLVSFTIDPKIRYALESLGYSKRMRRFQILVMSLFWRTSMTKTWTTSYHDREWISYNNIH